MELNIQEKMYTYGKMLVEHLNIFQLLVEHGASAVSAGGANSVGAQGNIGGAGNVRSLGGGAGGAVATGNLGETGKATVYGSNGGNATSYSGGARRRWNY